VALAAFSGSQSGSAVVISVLLAVTVVPRRRYPAAAFMVAAALGTAQVALGLQPSMADLAIVALLYTLAATGPRRISIAGLAVCLLGSGVAIARWAQVYPGPLFALVAGVGGLAVTAWVLPAQRPGR
jgi:hypothetical protein